MTSRENECSGDFGCPHCEDIENVGRRRVTSEEADRYAERRPAMTSTYDDFSRAEAELDASKLPPGSPAGETASEEFSTCKHGFLDCKICVAVPEPVPTEGLARVWIDPRTQEPCRRCDGTGKMPPWPGSKGLVACGVCRETEAARPSAPEAAAAGDEMPPWIQFACPTCHASSGAPCVAIASCMERVLLTSKSAAPIAPAAEVHMHLGIKESDLSTLDSQQLRALMGGIAQVLKSRGAA